MNIIGVLLNKKQIMKKLTTLIVLVCGAVWGQNPTSYTAEQKDETSSSFNLMNTLGFWHISGPRSYENHNNLSVFGITVLTNVI